LPQEGPTPCINRFAGPHPPYSKRKAPEAGWPQGLFAQELSGSVQVEAIETHYFGPGLDELA
jgi:hypothetical protein